MYCWCLYYKIYYSGNIGEKFKEFVVDLIVIKIEEEDEEDIGGLDMYVDVFDDSK